MRAAVRGGRRAPVAGRRPGAPDHPGDEVGDAGRQPVRRRHAEGRQGLGTISLPAYVADMLTPGAPEGLVFPDTAGGYHERDERATAVVVAGRDGGGIGVPRVEEGPDGQPRTVYGFKIHDTYALIQASLVQAPPAGRNAGRAAPQGASALGRGELTQQQGPAAGAATARDRAARRNLPRAGSGAASQPAVPPGAGQHGAGRRRARSSRRCNWPSRGDRGQRAAPAVAGVFRRVHAPSTRSTPSTPRPWSVWMQPCKTAWLGSSSACCGWRWRWPPRWG